MMNIDDFLEQVQNSPRATLHLPTVDRTLGRAPGELDALFELPLLALSTMVIAYQETFRTDTIGRRVIALLVEHFSSLRAAPQTLENSITLRRRCADALAFLEAAQLVIISTGRDRSITLSPSGRSLLSQARRDAGDLGLLVRRLRGSQVRVAGRLGNEG